MIKPITVYGNSVLRKECEDIEQNYPNIQEVIETMWQTLRDADGCGLAAPQINLPIKLFIKRTLLCGRGLRNRGNIHQCKNNSL